MHKKNSDSLKYMFRKYKNKKAREEINALKNKEKVFKLLKKKGELEKKGMSCCPYCGEAMKVTYDGKPPYYSEVCNMTLAKNWESCFIYKCNKCDKEFDGFGYQNLWNNPYKEWIKYKELKKKREELPSLILIYAMPILIIIFTIIFLLKNI